MKETVPNLIAIVVGGALIVSLGLLLDVYQVELPGDRFTFGVVAVVIILVAALIARRWTGSWRRGP